MDAFYENQYNGTFRVTYCALNTSYQGPLEYQLIVDDYLVNTEIEAQDDVKILNNRATMATGIKPHPFKVGDDVSYGFNGDYYHAGKIASFSKSGKFFTTDKGYKFTKKLINDELSIYSRELESYIDYKIRTEIFTQTGCSCFVAVKGIHTDKNPHF